MLRIASTLLLALASSLVLAQPKPAEAKDDKKQTIADKVKGFDAKQGLIPTYVDNDKAKVLLKFPPADPKTRIMGEYLYVESLATGLGANEVGLDRTGYGNTYVLQVKLIGEKVLFEVPNLNFRANTSNVDEQRAVKEGFVTSVIWAGAVQAKDADGSVLVDISDFLLKDVHGIGATLENQGGFTLDASRSTIDPTAVKAFPNNIEIEALLTFGSRRPSGVISRHAPDPQSLTFVQRHSFVKLPEPGYKPRKFDPRAGSFEVSYMDFAAPLDQPLTKMFIARHRLEKSNPSAARSTVKEPIVYYIDRGVPEPVRTALVDGGNYWKKAFEAAGFIDAFRVEVMPEDVDPLDVRYNVVQWMNRSTRGWAYGQSVVDPRTGEIIKGAVNLDSQRARQDIMIFEGLLGVDATGKGGPNDPINVALSRIRQLSAHEIGHTLGFQHNFAASFNNRASVMDYPAPLVKITPGGDFDLTDAYAQGVGPWDEQLVKYAYSEFAPGANEAAELEKVIGENFKRGLFFLSDADTTESTGASPVSNRWDNGNDPVKALGQSLRIRQLALDRFGEHNIRTGQPLANLEIVLGPIFFFHRYDVEATAKMIGGLNYRHAVRGDKQEPQRPIAGPRQRAALQALLTALQPSALEVPAKVAAMIGPRPNGYSGSAEEFAGNVAYAFDSVAAASSAADIVIAPLMNPARAARVIELSSRDTTLPTYEEVLNTLSAAVLKQPEGTPIQREIGWAVQHVFATRLMDLAANDNSSPSVRARAVKALRRTLAQEQALAAKDTSGHAAELAAQIQRFLARPLQDAKRAPAPPAPLPGQPIGSMACGFGG